MEVEFPLKKSILEKDMGYLTVINIHDNEEYTHDENNQKLFFMMTNGIGFSITNTIHM